MTALRITLVATLSLLAHGEEAAAFLSRGVLEVSVEVVVNAVGESPRSGCEVSEPALSYRKREWWVAVAPAKPHPEAGEEGVGPEIRCGSDAFGESNPDAASASPPPFLIAEGSTSARVITQMEDERLLMVKVSFDVRRLSGSDEDGRPLYQPYRVTRELFFSDDRSVFVPLVVANSDQQEALGIHEAFVRVAARKVEARASSLYGSITVRSGWQQADLLLDRGSVGEIREGSVTTLRNVPVGVREVGVRDATGREIRKVVRVEAGRMAALELSPPEPDASSASHRLTPLGPNEQGYEEYRRGADGAVVVKIPAGEFLMGNRETERTPLEHPVYVSEFLMDELGVTWGRFRRFAEATGALLPAHEPYWGIHDDHPVVYVSWEDAKAYCEWAGGRLPTEAEREKAARGTDERKYPWGNEEPEPERAVFRRSWGHEATAAVGTHPDGASPYGLHDMGGNVWEWCADWYDGEYYAVSPARDPRGPATGTAHVVRGGSWDSRPSVLSASCRSWGHRGYRDGDFGFRCAMNAPR